MFFFSYAIDVVVASVVFRNKRRNISPIARISCFKHPVYVAYFLYNKRNVLQARYHLQIDSPKLYINAKMGTLLICLKHVYAWFQTLNQAPRYLNITTKLGSLFNLLIYKQRSDWLTD